MDLSVLRIVATCALITFAFVHVYACDDEDNVEPTSNDEFRIALTDKDSRQGEDASAQSENLNEQAKKSRAEHLRQAEDRIRAIYERYEYSARPWSAKWSADGKAFTRVENKGRGRQELVSYDASTGRRTVIFTNDQLIRGDAPKPRLIHGYEIAASGTEILLMSAAEHGSNDDVDFQFFDAEDDSIKRIVDRIDPRRGRLGRSMSPDGKHVLFASQRSLEAINIREDRSVKLIEIEDGVHLGKFVWSPDGSRIAFMQIDVRRIKRRAVLLPTDPTFPEVGWHGFSLPGGPIPRLRVGVVDVDGGQVRWMAIPEEEEGFYIGDLGWSNDSKEVVVKKLSRSFDDREFFLADAQTGTVRSLYRETDPAWVEASYRTNAGLDWISGGKEFLILSEKGGWRQAFVFSKKGKELRCLTPVASDIIRRGFVDEESGWFYFLASPNNATQRFLYRVRLDGSTKPERITPNDQRGSYDYNFSPKGRWAICTRSTFDTPPVTELVQLPDHKSVRVLEENRALRKRVAPLIPRPTEFFQLEIDEGVKMDAWLIKPRDFDPANKYPVLVFVYGETHAQTVLDDWNGGQYFTMFHRAIADLGYLVVSMDNRGTPAPKGAAWRRAVYGSLGPLSTKEQAAGLRELGRTRRYVDMSRIGIWGWSGGGTSTLNAMFREGNLYRVGIAIAPKPQPRLFNAAYQENYMRTPETNPEGYRTSAAINFAEGLEGDLLIVHGSGETNTHIQMVEGLVDRLIALGKQFDYMVYPNRDHGIRRGQGTTVHLHMLITRYLIDHLPPGPIPIE